MAINKPVEIATIDACLVVLTKEDESGEAIGITSNTEVATEIQTEETDDNKLIIKQKLKAQKVGKKTVTGVQVTLTDNLTVLELAQAVQGGTITRDSTGKITKYTPPLIDSDAAQDKYTLDVYSACMDTAGDTLQYEKITYKHCTGDPVAYNAKDDEWRSTEYVLKSLPKGNEAPYEITYVDELPEVTEPTVNG